MKLISRHSLPFALTVALSTAAVSSLAAPAQKNTADIGRATFHAGKMLGSGVGNKNSHVSLIDGFTVKSTSGEYEITGATADITESLGAVDNITARGTSTEQVTVKFYNQAEGGEVAFLSDKAVMVPSPTEGELKRQRITFTGNVTMYVSSPAALAEPSKSTMEKAIVYVGSGPDYPQVEADDVNGTAVPAASH